MLEILWFLLMLGSDSIEEREEATQRLAGSGRKAWPMLEAALRSRDPEVAARAREILSDQFLPEAFLARHPELVGLTPTRRAALLLPTPWDGPEEFVEIERTDEEEVKRPPDPEGPRFRLQRLKSVRVRPIND